MALRGSFSQSFLRSKELLAYSEISHDKEGNYILDNEILKEALARDNKGKLIRNKSNIAKVLNKYGILYRMVFNAMNMETYTYNEVQEALDHLSWYINDLGVSGIIEFHAADKTQNSDHIHFWISSEDKIIYNKIAQEMVTMGYSNKEDVYIQKYETNEKLEESAYVNEENMTISKRFSLIPIGQEAGETLDSINEMLSIEKTDKIDSSKSQFGNNLLPTLLKKYHLILNTIANLFQIDNSNNENKTTNFNEHSKSIPEKTSILENCSLPKTEETRAILLRIKDLKEQQMHP